MGSVRTGRIVAMAAAVAWMGVIFGLSSIPASSLPGRFGGLAHFAVYAVLGGLYFASIPASVGRWRRLLAAVALSSIYGITDELHQSFVPGRVPDVGDWLVDTAGALVAAASLDALTARSRSRSRQRSRVSPIGDVTPDGR